MLINEKISERTNCLPEEETSLIFEELFEDKTTEEDDEWELEEIEVKIDSQKNNLDLPTIR